ncbi:hypothetical protein [Parabacteroides sp. Marseille-P3160]|uniref:hypothetical protein n=1 Tax=Parabacteroides sp. Marseille-P3160 TaxID=1917887 RepID=UPI00190E82F4|nr:hypothetical protein [Parabacteroides sp. Marseille-P3160]
MTARDFGMGFFGRIPFGADARKDFFAKWTKMTDAEKVEFMDKRIEAIHNGHCGRREFSVAAIDQRCEEWMKKTSEEKEAFVKEQQEMIAAFHEHAGFFGHGRGFDFGFSCGEESTEKDAKTK